MSSERLNLLLFQIFVGIVFLVSRGKSSLFRFYRWFVFLFTQQVILRNWLHTIDWKKWRIQTICTGVLFCVWTTFTKNVLDWRRKMRKIWLASRPMNELTLIPVEKKNNGSYCEKHQCINKHTIIIAMNFHYFDYKNCQRKNRNTKISLKKKTQDAPGSRFDWDSLQTMFLIVRL